MNLSPNKPMHSISREDFIVCIRFDLPPTKQEVMGINRQLVAMKDVGYRMWVIPPAFDLSQKEIREIAHDGNQLGFPPSRVAMVASDDLPYGLLRMVDVYRENPDLKTRVFRSEPDAVQWLTEERDQQG